MANFLNITFTGLCGFVPNTSYKKARVLLVDANEPSGGHVHGSPHEPHVPVLVCDPRRIKSTSRQADLIFRQAVGTSGVDEFAVFFLHDQDLSFGNAAATELTIKNDALSDVCPDSASYESIRWLTSLASISPGPTGQPGSEVVRKECLADPSAGETVYNKVAARISLTAGTLSARSPARAGTGDTTGIGNVIKWEFKVPGGSPFSTSRSITETVLARLELTSGAEPVISTQLLRKTELQRIKDIFPGGLGTQKKIELNASAGNEVYIRIENVPYADLLGLREPLALGERYADWHFDHFYELSKHLRDRRIPDPLKTAICTNSGGLPSLRTPQCPPALYGAHADA
jgi:hypothetical protein